MVNEKSREYTFTSPTGITFYFSHPFFKHKRETITGAFVSRLFETKKSIIRLYKTTKKSRLLYISFFSHRQDYVKLVLHRSLFQSYH
jgi:hypothetical protein